MFARDKFNDSSIAPGNVPGGAKWFLAGVPTGLLFLLSTQLEARWFFFLFGLSLIAMVSVALPGKKSFYLFCLAFSVPIGINLHIDLTTSLVYRSTHAFMISISHIPMVALLVIYFYNRFDSNPKTGLPWINILPLGALIASSCISMVFNGEWRFGIFDVYALFASVVLFVCVSNVVEETRDLRLAVSALVLALAIQAVIARAQDWTGSSLGLEFFGSRTVMPGFAGLSSISRAAGTLFHPNSLALYFDLTLPLAFSLLFCPMKASGKWLLASAFALGMLGLFSTLSRGGMFSTLVALTFVLIVQLRKRIGVFMTGGAVAAAVMVGAVLLLGTPTSIQERFLKHDYGTARGRLKLMGVTLRLIGSHPLWGTGPNNFVPVATRYDNTPEQIVVLWNAPVHNLFFFIAGEIGLVGLVCFCLFFLSVMLSLAPAIRSPDPFLYCTGTGLFFCFLAFVMHSQVDYCSWTHFVPLWFMAGLAVSAGRIASRSPGAGVI